MYMYTYDDPLPTHVGICDHTHSQSTIRAHSEHIQITFRAHSEHVIYCTFCISYFQEIILYQLELFSNMMYRKCCKLHDLNVL